jgi:hypothetical protein
MRFFANQADGNARTINFWPDLRFDVGLVRAVVRSFYRFIVKLNVEVIVGAQEAQAINAFLILCDKTKENPLLGFCFRRAK